MADRTKTPIPPIGSDVLLEQMKREGIPLTREDYLARANLEEPLSAEHEANLPAVFREGTLDA